MKPRNINQPARNENSEQKEFVPIIPEEGLVPVQVGLLVDLGSHKKQPKFAKDNAGNREQDEDGNDKILWPKEGAVEQKISCYIDLLDQTHDYEGDIGVKNIRLPLHTVNRGMAEGLNFTTVAPRDPKTQAYIKGRPWILAGTSQFYKIAGVTKYADGTKVADTIFKAEYKNPKLNNIEELLGKPFMFNLEVKKTEKDGKTFVNTKLKSPVPLMKGMNPPEALIPAVAVNFDDEDLLEEKEELSGVAKFDLLRMADLRKIVLAEEYQGSKMQEAVVERNGKDGEKEIIAKAKEIAEKIAESDKDLQEILEKFPQGKPQEGEAPQEAKPAAKQEKPKKPAPKQEEDDSSCPF
jgi:hypothetical protein